MGIEAVEVARLREFDADGRLAIDVDGARVALVRTGDRVHALDDLCLCCGGSLLHAPAVGDELVCPGCGWRYALGTGAVAGLPALQLPTFPVTVVDGRVLIEIARPGPG